MVNLGLGVTALVKEDRKADVLSYMLMEEDSRAAAADRLLLGRYPKTKVGGFWEALDAIAGVIYKSIKQRLAIRILDVVDQA